MANGENEVGVDAPAGGFVQLLTPDGERVDSVTTADGMTYSADFTDDELTVAARRPARVGTNHAAPSGVRRSA